MNATLINDTIKDYKLGKIDLWTACLALFILGCSVEEVEKLLGEKIPNE